MQWTVSVVQRDEEGEAFYLGSYRPFRLESLRLDPQAFGSTFERESGFGDEQWLQRLRNPAATTFVARGAAEGDGREHVLSSLTLLRIPGPDGGAGDRQAPLLHWAVNAVYTVPRARRRGVAAAVLAEAVRWARGAAAAATCSDGSGRRACLLSVHVYETNARALGLYKAAGFRVVGRRREEEEGGGGSGGGRTVCALQLEIDADPRSSACHGPAAASQPEA